MTMSPYSVTELNWAKSQPAMRVEKYCEIFFADVASIFFFPKELVYSLFTNFQSIHHLGLNLQIHDLDLLGLWLQRSIPVYWAYWPWISSTTLTWKKLKVREVQKAFKQHNQKKQPIANFAWHVIWISIWYFRFPSSSTLTRQHWPRWPRFFVLCKATAYPW